MTWAELIAQPIKPDAEVWLSVFPPHYIVRQNFRVDGLRQEGGVVFVDGMEEDMRESNP